MLKLVLLIAICGGVVAGVGILTHSEAVSIAGFSLVGAALLLAVIWAQWRAAVAQSRLVLWLDSLLSSRGDRPRVPPN
jgi:hypothetical protein